MMCETDPKGKEFLPRSTWHPGDAEHRSAGQAARHPAPLLATQMGGGPGAAAGGGFGPTGARPPRTVRSRPDESLLDQAARRIDDALLHRPRGPAEHLARVRGIELP